MKKNGAKKSGKRTTTRRSKPLRGKTLSGGKVKKTPRTAKGRGAAKVSSRNSITLVLRSTMVRPEKTKRDTVTQKKVKGSGWFGTETHKNKATIITRYRYLTLDKRQILDDDLKAIVKKFTAAEQSRFKKSKSNSMSVTAQYVKGKIVDKHRARMAASAQVGTMIYGESIAKKVRVNVPLQDGGTEQRIIQTPAKFMPAKFANQQTNILDMVSKMQEYGLVSVKSAREKLKQQAIERRKKNKNIALTNRQEKGMIE